MTLDQKLAHQRMLRELPVHTHLRDWGEDTRVMQQKHGREGGVKTALLMKRRKGLV